MITLIEYAERKPLPGGVLLERRVGELCKFLAGSPIVTVASTPLMGRNIVSGPGRRKLPIDECDCRRAAPISSSGG